GANGYARHIQNSPLNAISHKQQRMDKLLSLSGNGLSEIVNNIDRWTSLRDNWSFSLTEEEEDKVRDALATLPEPYKLKIDENDEHEKSCLIESIESKVSIPLEDVPSTLGVIDVVSDITSDDIFSFYNHLVKYPMLGLEHEVGKRILEQIEHSKRFTATDLTIYRARERKRELPFSDVEMFEAPFGLAGHGRYNVWGHGELYTCDNKETAIEELKVSSASCVDVVTWRLQTPLDVLDLVEVDSPLVRYCSYTKQTATNLEYLVPNFLSQCAKFVGIHGIRFRSNMNNQVINYVFFDFEHRYFKTVNLERNYITLE
ncbi:RES family NAD+ phosphorylase, partial [Brevibacillus porteri]|uniref:RES family NAD+ phosphorylase n=1 Tax=Brevibacillus porteri TaxID=2126350 RepID=UPI003D1E493F